MKNLLQIFIFIWCLATAAFAQQSGTLTLQTTDGTQVRGLIMTLTADEVTLQNSAGIYTLKRAQLTSESQNAVLKLEAGDDPEVLRRKIAEQDRMIAALRAENQQLRAALVQSTPTASPASTVPTLRTSTVVPSNIQPSTTAASSATGYWISSTGKRHNSNCRYYQTSQGRPGVATEGVACKICGG